MGQLTNETVSMLRANNHSALTTEENRVTVTDMTAMNKSHNSINATFEQAPTNELQAYENMQDFDRADSFTRQFEDYNGGGPSIKADFDLGLLGDQGNAFDEQAHQGD